MSKDIFDRKGLVLKVGVWLNSVALKIQKPSWTNAPLQPLSFQQSIFFSIWVNDDTLARTDCIITYMP